MIDIDLGESDKAIKISMNGKDVYLSDPSKGQIESLGKAMDEAEPDKADEIFKGFMVKLGFPEDVYDSLGVLRTKKLAEGFMDGLTGKK